MVRINKYLAECGLGSRRGVEEIVLAGRVSINNKVVRDLFTVVKETDKVSLDGKKVAPILKHLYLLLHKPKATVTTTKDPEGRKTIIDYLPKKYKEKRVFPIGRLDYDTEGLIILTTDGFTANRVMHPSNNVAKIYLAKLESDITEKEIELLRKGVILEGGEKTKPCKIKRLPSQDDEKARLEVTITEGRNRQIRRMFEAINKVVIFLKRTQIGDIRLGGLSRGEVRELTQKEIDYIKRL